MKLISISDMWLTVIAPASKAELVRTLINGYESEASVKSGTPLDQGIAVFSNETGITVFWPGVPKEYVAKRTGRKGLFFEFSDEVLAVVLLKLFSDICDKLIVED